MVLARREQGDATRMSGVDVRLKLTQRMKFEVFGLVVLFFMGQVNTQMEDTG